MSDKEIRKLYQLLRKYEKVIKEDSQPLAAQVVFMVASWVMLDFE